jgi:hypothetical protein
MKADAETGRNGDAGQELRCARNPRVTPSPSPRVFCFILPPSSLILSKRTL